MKRSFVESAQTWEQFVAKIPHKHYTAVANRRLEGIYNDARRDLGARFDAYLERMSWGNFSEYACQRTQKPGTSPEIRPLVQADVARALNVDRRRIQELVELRQDEGLMARSEDLVNPGLLVPLFEPVAPRERSSEPGYVRGALWKAFSPRWDEEHPDLVAKLTAAEQTRREIQRRKLADFKTAQNGRNSPDDAGVDGPELPGLTVPYSPVEMSDTPAPDLGPANHGHAIAPYPARATNVKQETETPSSSSNSTPTFSGESVTHDNLLGSRLATQPEMQESLLGSRLAAQPETMETERGDPLFAAVARYVPADIDLIKRLRRQCRDTVGDVTTEEIAYAVHQKGKPPKGVEKPGGYLIASVLNWLKANLPGLREAEQRRVQLEAESARRRRGAEAQMRAEELLDHRVELAWDAMTPQEQKKRRALAWQALPREDRRRLDQLAAPGVRESEIDRYALRALREAIRGASE